MAVITLASGSTNIELQTAIDSAAFGDIIELSGDMPFSDKVTIRQGLEITIRSSQGNNWVMQHFNPGVRHFEMNGSLILENITLDGRDIGGGIQINQGAFALMNGALINHCYAENGGGIHMTAGVLSIYGGTISENNAKKGGGIYVNAGLLNMAAASARIAKNKADYGGGVFVNGGTYSYTGGNLEENEALNGGGVYMNGGTLSMTRGNFINNTALANGGGIYSVPSVSLEISGSSTVNISGNKAIAGHGGGIFTEDATFANIITGTNVVFSCNRASKASAPPENAAVLYPEIGFSETTIREHPLNNYDIRYENGDTIKVSNNIIYESNGGTGRFIGPDTAPCDTDIVLAVEETGIQKDGCNFIGWNTAPDGSGLDYIPGSIIDPAINATLYAQWDVYICPVVYKDNCSSESYIDRDACCGEKYTVLSLSETGIKRCNYIFTGWNTDPCGKGICYMPGSKIDLNGGIILYAQWKPCRCRPCYRRSCDVYYPPCRKTNGCNFQNDFWF